jgi:hypothetical protein
MPDILTENDLDAGEYEFEIFTVEVNTTNYYENNLIRLDTNQ